MRELYTDREIIEARVPVRRNVGGASSKRDGGSQRDEAVTKRIIRRGVSVEL